MATDLHHEFWRSAVRELVASLTARGVVSLFVRLHPLLPYDGEALREYGVLVRHGSTVSIDLRPPEEEIVGSFRANHRRQINRARRAGLAVAADDWSLLPQFVDAYHDTMTRVSAEAAYFFPPSYFDRLRAEVGEATHLIAAVRGQRLLAGGLFFECGGIVQYHLGATRSDSLAEQPMKLVFDETCRWARRRGDTDLHLGGGVGGSVADSLFHFKAGFSNRRHPFETFRCVVDGSVYRRLSAGCGSADDADDLTGFFPAFRRKATATPTVPVVTADAVCQPPRGTREQRRTRRN